MYDADMNDVTSASPTYRLLWGLKHIEERLEAALEPLGLSLAKFGCLARLVDAGEALPLRTLADRQACVRSNITQLVDRLEAEKLVVRADDPHDRRSVRAALTSEGRARHAQALNAIRAVERELFSRLPAKRAEELLESLRLLAGGP
jgi:DNA-binding MarR family transcriptional regulator